MQLKSIAILSPGDMGHSVGKVLHDSGFDVLTCLSGRSLRTVELARIGNFRIVETMDELVVQSDLILSILVPDRAREIGCEVASSLVNTGQNTYFVECNAISPDSSKIIEQIITESGGRFIDGGIIGSAPAKGDSPRFYVSGPESDVMSALDGTGIVVKVVGDKVGQASGIKMCYAALTKGSNTLHVALLAAAHKMGLTDTLREELSNSQSSHLKVMENGISKLPANSHRWIGEMEEISATFESLGVTPLFHMGAAEIYRALAATPFASETPESIDPDRSAWETIEVASTFMSKSPIGESD
jgi:3-hydroxyisobutyrate dehydrogenase-like beta-hydroxyacid dehydrogenase